MWGCGMAVRDLTQDDASRLLDDLRQGLNADGYDLRVAVDGRVQLRIVVAREDACEDCLVPKEIMSQMAAAALQERDGGITAADIDLLYPAEH